MMFLKSATPIAVFTAALLSSPLHASFLPFGKLSSLSPSRIWERGLEGNLGSLADLVMAVQDYLSTENAWDPEVPGKCVLTMTTESGSNCHAYLQCDMTDEQGPLLQPDPWNVCYLGGQQKFSDPNIGDFSITFTEAGGQNGNTVDGLHTPVLELANLNNWEPINIESIVAQSKGQKGNLCTLGGVASDQLLSWTCGIPKIGQAAFGMSNYNPPAPDGTSGSQPATSSSAPASGYAPGVCSAHVVQYQKNEFGVGAQYAFDVVLYDANKKEIGLVQKVAVDPTTLQLDVTSQLPYVFIVTAGAVDDDDVNFAYAGQSWACGNGNDFGNTCDLGSGPRWGYENGDRKGDMSFNC